MRSMVLSVAAGTLALAACAGSRMAVAPPELPPAAEATPAPVTEGMRRAPETTAETAPAAALAPAAVTDSLRSAAAPEVTATPTDAGFETTVRPLLARTCTPCHVPGGKMYDRMPFDQPKIVQEFQAGILRRLKVAEERQAVEDWLKTTAAR